jgi:single-strand DNA-binding protein
MASLNKVFLIGNLTRDPEVRYTPAGKAVADLRLAVNRRFKTNDGEDRDETCFITVVVWGRQAETCGEYLSKGSPLLVDGRLQYDEWEKEGQKFNRIRVVASRVQFLGSPKSGGVQAQPQAEPQPGPQDAGGGPAVMDKNMGDDDNLPF